MRAAASSVARKPAHRVQELVALRLRRIARGQRARHAVPHVVVEDLERQRLEGGIHRGDLRDDVDAVAVVLDHPLDAADLPFDSVETLDERVLVLGVAVFVRLRHAVAPSVVCRALRKRRNRRLFVTTNRLEAAIATAATIGLSKPATASGTAATL